MALDTMPRHEFPQKVRKAAIERAGDRCEAVGIRWGHEPGRRCTAILSQTKVELDHWPLGAHAEGSGTLDNCVVCCRACNQYAANHTDKAVEAKIKRVRIKHGIDPAKRLRPKPKLSNRGFDKTKSRKFNGQVIDRR